MDDLMGDFIADTREMLDAIAGEIVAWEADPTDRARLDAIFRFVHTVKGSCGFLDLPRLARLSHAAEDVLADVRDGRRVPDARLVSAVLGVIDRIGELAQAIGSGESLPADEDRKLIAALSSGSVAEPPPPQVAPAQRGQARTVRLQIELLDRIMNGAADLVLARNELALRLREAGHDAAVGDALDRLSASVAAMRAAVTRTRMQRLDQLFAALPRMVRDLAAELGRSVTLELEGGDVELDREMIESIRYPIAHIIRNAIDHGIEPPEQRAAAGKPAAGLLRICARQSGNQILIEAVDDGRGIDGDALAARAVAAGIASEAQATAMPWSRKLALTFEPGLSTARVVTAISGRGVGMDVVRANMERIGGVIEIDSRPGQGTRILLRVPLTVTTVPALIISTADRQFAIPLAAVGEVVPVGPDGAWIEAMEGGRVATVRGRQLPLVELARLLGGRAADEPAMLVVVEADDAAPFALAIDAAHDHQELVVKPVGPAERATGLYAGATLPDTGAPMLLLDPAGLAAAGSATAAGDAEDSREPAKPTKTCLVVDDSRMIRAVARNILETLDFTVEEAADGREALARCRASPPDVVLLDWNMPVMSGIEFMRALTRADLPRRPKVLFCTTERDLTQIRAAIDAGADEYVMKPFDRDMLRSKLELAGVG